MLCHAPFSLPLSLNLSNSDILTIYDGDEVMPHILGQYLGSSGPQKLYSSTPDLTIQFHSDPAGLIFGKGQGFIMNYVGRCLLRSIFPPILRILVKMMSCSCISFRGILCFVGL